MVIQTNRLFFNIILSLLLASCTTIGKVNEALSLNAAIDNASKIIVSKLSLGTRVAIVNVDSSSIKLSDYIWEELTFSLVNAGMTVADRSNLPYIYDELNFQMSGDVSDETALGVGKFIGAQSVITVQLLDIGKAYRLGLNSFNVQLATREVSDRQVIQKNLELNNLLAAIENNNLVSKKADYAVEGIRTTQNAGALLDIGISFAIMKEYDKAIESYTEAIKLDTNFVAAYTLRGNAYALKENFKQSILDYTQALKIDSNYVEALRGRGTSFLRIEEYQKCIVDYTQALELNKNGGLNYLLYLGRGYAYERMSNYVKAIADYTNVIKIKPNDDMTYFQRGVAYFFINEYDKALNDFLQVLKINPDYNEAQSYLDAVRLERGY
jgi:tetratricopeptide (TPR) repeat protein